MILLIQKLGVFYDHKYLTCKYFNIDSLLRPVLILDEYRPEIYYIYGENNIVNDAISSLFPL